MKEVRVVVVAGGKVRQVEVTVLVVVTVLVDGAGVTVSTSVDVEVVVEVAELVITAAVKVGTGLTDGATAILVEQYKSVLLCALTVVMAAAATTAAY